MPSRKPYKDSIRKRAHRSEEVINYLEQRRQERIKAAKSNSFINEIFSADKLLKRHQEEKFFVALRAAQLLTHIKNPYPIHKLIAERLAATEFKSKELKRLYGHFYTLLGTNEQISKIVLNYEHVQYLLTMEITVLANALSSLFDEGKIVIEKIENPKEENS